MTILPSYDHLTFQFDDKVVLHLIYRDEISFALKTAAEYGVLYYTSDIREIDFTGLYLFRGTLVYVFNYGSGVLEIQSSVPVNDNRWHEVLYMVDLIVNKTMITQCMPSLEARRLVG